MKRKVEDKLAMLAFGDVSREEALRLEQEASNHPAAAKALAEYRQMREGLKAMADIPPHQLSTERLRTAVLAQGLKPKSRPSYGWLWMPATAMALAFGVVMIRNMQVKSTPNTQVAMLDSNDLHFSKDAGAFKVPDWNDIVKTQPPVAKINTTSPVQANVGAPRPQVASYVPHRRTSDLSSRHSDKSRLVAQLEQQVKDGFAKVQPYAMNSSEGMRSVAFAASAPAATEGVVLIDSKKDLSTGAQRATEVDSASNVVVGG